jgi:hypothetical protein
MRVPVFFSLLCNNRSGEEEHTEQACGKGGEGSHGKLLCSGCVRFAETILYTTMAVTSEGSVPPHLMEK